MTFQTFFTNYIAECLHAKLDKVYTVGDETMTEPQEIIVREDVGTDALFLKPNAIFLLSKVGGAERSVVPSVEKTKCPFLFTLVFDVNKIDEVRKAIAEISEEQTGFLQFTVDGQKIYTKLSFGIYSFATPFDIYTKGATPKAVVCSWYVSAEYSPNAYLGGIIGTLKIGDTSYPLKYCFQQQNSSNPNFAQRLPMGKKDLEFSKVNNSKTCTLSIVAAADDNLQKIFQKELYDDKNGEGLAGKSIVYTAEGETFTAQSYSLTKVNAQDGGYYLLTLTR